MFSSVLSVHAELVTAFFRLRSTSVKEDFIIFTEFGKIAGFFLSEVLLFSGGM